MISLYSGTPGSGKSLDAAAKVRASLKWYRPVIGTFHINKDCLYKNSKYEYTYVNIYNLKPEFLVKYAKEHMPAKRNPEGSFLLVIDEAQRIFNSRDWNSQDRMGWITFFAEHRHLGFDIILISQNDRMLDRQIRALIEYNYIHRKLSAFGILGKIFSIFSGQFVVVRQWYPLKERIDGSFFRGEKKLYDFYDSFEDFGCTEDGVERSSGDPAEGREKFLKKLMSIERVSSINDEFIYQKYIDALV